MKKINFFAIYAAIFLGIVHLSQPLTAQTKPIAIVVKTTGISYHIKGKKKTPIRVKDFVQSGDIIHAKKNALVHLQFSSGIIFSLGSPQSVTEVKINNFISKQGSTKIQMEVYKGSLASSTEKLSKKDYIEVVTPTAIAGVRGTEFLVDVEKESTEVLVNDGLVSVSDIEKEKEVMVEPGKKVVATTTGLQLEIIKKFEKQRFEIFKALEDSKQKNIEALKEQVERDRKNLESVKNPFEN